MKKILYIKAQGLGDIIGGIPFLVEQKKLGNKVYQTFYDMRHINKGVEKLSKKEKEKYKKYPMYGGWYNMLNTIKQQNLIEDIVTIPYGIWNLIFFFFSNFRKYDEVIIPIKTTAAQILGWILGKKTRIVFKDTNDISQYKILADGECSGKALALYEYNRYFSLPQETIDIPEHFVTIFPSIYERSLEINEWINIIKHCREIGYKVLLIGGDREQRFVNELKKNKIYQLVEDYMSKTSLNQISYVLAHAKICISGNGGPMWMANLLNPHCINIHTTSAYLMQPPVNKKTSFNIREYLYPECKPCECADSTVGRTGISGCVFYNTPREGECRKAANAIIIQAYIKKIIEK